jgi:hypothetical protein
MRYQVSEAVIKRAVSEAEHATWLQLLVRSAADEHPYVRWCPARDCDSAIVAQTLPLLDCRCSM